MQIDLRVYHCSHLLRPSRSRLFWHNEVRANVRIYAHLGDANVILLVFAESCFRLDAKHVSAMLRPHASNGSGVDPGVARNTFPDQIHAPAHSGNTRPVGSTSAWNRHLSTPFNRRCPPRSWRSLRIEHAVVAGYPLPSEQYLTVTRGNARPGLAARRSNPRRARMVKESDPYEI
jgi:hypothetical protein